MKDYDWNLREYIYRLSSSDNNWDIVSNEWELLDYAEYLGDKCVCGKTGLIYNFWIFNTVTKNTSDIIGSACIDKFQNGTLKNKVKTVISLYKLKECCKSNNWFIDFNYKSKDNKRYFSRNIIKFLYDLKVLEIHDYNFLIKSFNKKSKLEPYDDRRISAIMINKVKPFLKEVLDIKGKNSYEN